MPGLMIAYGTFEDWPNLTVTVQVSVIRQGPDNPYQLHTQTTQHRGPRVIQQTQVLDEWAAVVKALDHTGVDRSRLHLGLRTAIANAAEDDISRDSTILDAAAYWAEHQRVTEWIEETPAYARQHGGDTTAAANALLGRLTATDDSRSIIPIDHNPDDDAWNERLGSYEITDHTDRWPWTVEIDMYADGYGEVYARVRAESFRPASCPV